MVWQYRSSIPVRRRGVISSFKLFLPAIATCREWGGSAPCGQDKLNHLNISCFNSNVIDVCYLEQNGRLPKVEETLWGSSTALYPWLVRLYVLPLLYLLREDFLNSIITNVCNSVVYHTRT
jgi:hypothetical protein